MFCTQCGSGNAEEAKFCLQCGAAFTKSPSTKKLETSFALGAVGSTLLFFGVFCPIVSLPIVGNVNYFRNGEGDGVLVVCIALASLILTLKKKFWWLRITGTSALLILVYTLLNLTQLYSKLQSDVSTDSDGLLQSLTGLMVSSIQIQWGWALLVVGACITASAGFGHRKDMLRNANSLVGIRSRRLRFTVVVVIALAFVSIPLFFAHVFLISARDAANTINASRKLPKGDPHTEDFEFVNTVSVSKEEVFSILSEFRSRASNPAVDKSDAAKNYFRRMNEVYDDSEKVAMIKFINKNEKIATFYADGFLDVKTSIEKRSNSLTQYSMALELTKLALDSDAKLEQGIMSLRFDISSHKGVVKEVLDIGTDLRGWRLYKVITFKLGQKLTPYGKVLWNEEEWNKEELRTNVFIAFLVKNGAGWSVERLVEKSTGRQWWPERTPSVLSPVEIKTQR